MVLLVGGAVSYERSTPVTWFYRFGEDLQGQIADVADVEPRARHDFHGRRTLDHVRPPELVHLLTPNQNKRGTTPNQTKIRTLNQIKSALVHTDPVTYLVSFEQTFAACPLPIGRVNSHTETSAEPRR